MTELNFERVGMESVDKVWKIVSRCASWLLKEKGLDHWSSYYTREMIEDKISSCEVYLVSEENVSVGTFCISEKMFDFYNELPRPLPFKDLEVNAFYPSMLAVDPDHQGKGVASKILEFLEQIARERGIKYIRFDCREEYSDLVSFYKKRGFVEVGRFSEGEGQNCLLMEKEIK